MVLRLNTLMVLAVAADECMCQLFPVRGGDGQLKFAANDDGSCIAEKLFRAPRLEAGEELIVGDTNVMDRVESIQSKALQTREQLDARDAELEQALQDTLEYLEAKSLGLQTNLTATQEERAAALLEEIQRIESQEVSDAESFRTSIEGLSESLDAHKVASDEKLESVSLAVRESAEATQTYLEEAISEWDVKFEEERERAATVATEHANALDAKITEVEVPTRCRRSWGLQITWAGPRRWRGGRPCAIDATHALFPRRPSEPRRRRCAMRSCGNASRSSTPSSWRPQP